MALTSAVVYSCGARGTYPTLYQQVVVCNLHLTAYTSCRHAPVIAGHITEPGLLSVGNTSWLLSAVVRRVRGAHPTGGAEHRAGIGDGTRGAHAAAPPGSVDRGVDSRHSEKLQLPLDLQRRILAIWLGISAHEQNGIAWLPQGDRCQCKALWDYSQNAWTDIG